jgi:putative ABC transport system substrate-binding protein
MIVRRRFLLLGGIGLLVVHPLSRGQPAPAVRRVGILSGTSEVATGRLRAAFSQAMQELGWMEGKNVEYRIAYANGDVGRLDALASELIEQKAEVLVLSNSQAARAAQRTTKTIPIVMAGVSNAVGAGFIATLAKPGGNITGFTSQQEEVLGKLIGIVHEATPGARRMAVLLNESNPSHAVFWAGAQSACAALDLVAIRVVASTPEQLGAATAEIVRQRSQAVVVIPDGLFLTERAKLQELMQSARLPVAYLLREQVIAGGLLSYGADLEANYRNAAKYVDKILKGAKPADLPVERTTKYELVINLRTAKALGIAIPQSLLLRADEVIQ